MKTIPILFAFLLAGPVFAADVIYAPNLGKNVTGTTVGAANGIDVNVISPISATNPSVGVIGAAVPLSATTLGADKGGNLVAPLIGQQTMANSLACVLPSNQSAIPVIPAAGTTATAVQSTVVGNGAAVSFSAPANAISVSIEASSSNTQNLRCAAGTTATTTLGLRLEPGRSFDNIPTSATVTCIAEAGSNQEVNLQWISQ